MFRFSIGLWCGLLACGLGSTHAAGAAQTGDIPAWSSITAEDLRSWVHELASDRLAGRGTGEEGGQLAEEMIAAAFADAGLSPLPGRDDYFLPFSLHRRGFDPEATDLWIEGAAGARSRGRSGVDFRPFDFSDVGELEAEVVFGGYGITATDLGYDDYQDLDVAGKVVLLLRHEPRETDPASPFDGEVHSPHAFFVRKMENAREHGARGMLIVTDPLHHDPGDDFRMQGPLYLDPDEAAFATERSEQARDLPFLAAHIDRDLADFLFAGTGTDLLSVQRKIDETMQPVPVDLRGPRVRLRFTFQPELRAIEARNVAGFLPGSDPALTDQWIVVGAHHDHLGAFEGPGDSVYNGADDNGSGTAAVLSLARAFANADHRPRRSIVFTTFGAEERGLLGSRAMVGQGQIDVDKVVFLLNMDMIGRNPDRALALSGDGFIRGVEEIVEAANAALNVHLEYGGLSLMANSDHVAFYEREIPFLTFFTGTHEDYHQLGDHPDLLDYPRMERIARLAHGIVGRVADRDAPLPFLRDLQWLGAKVETETSGDGSTAARVVEVEPDSRAARVDIREGDVITSIGGNEVANPRRVGAQFAEIPPGTKTSIRLHRETTELDLVVKVERAPTGYLGIAPGAVAEEVRKTLGLTDNEGVLVRQVIDEGPAMIAGLESGDVLVAINGRPVDLGNLRRRLAQIGADEVVEIALLRKGERRSLPVKLGVRG